MPNLHDRPVYNPGEGRWELEDYIFSTALLTECNRLMEDEGAARPPTFSAIGDMLRGDFVEIDSSYPQYNDSAYAYDAGLEDASFLPTIAAIRGNEARHTRSTRYPTDRAVPSPPVEEKVLKPGRPRGLGVEYKAYCVGCNKTMDVATSMTIDGVIRVGIVPCKCAEEVRRVGSRKKKPRAEDTGSASYEIRVPDCFL